MAGSLPALPADFLFGVACADHQCEAYDPAFPPDVWDWWEQRGQVPQPRRHALDFWRFYPEHVALARDLGCTAFRFSIAWARVEPAPGVFDPTALDHYARVAETVRAHGMEPIVTLCHYTWPLHLEWDGGLIAPSFPPRFARYAERVREVLAPHVRYWLTFNEPNDLVLTHSSFNRRFPPGAPAWRALGDQIGDMEALIRNLFLAHRDARQALRAGPSGDRALVSMNPNIRGFPIRLRRLLDGWVRTHFATARGLRNAVAGLLFAPPVQDATQGIAHLMRTLTLLFDGDWWELGMLGHLPPYLCPPGCANQLDFVALDFYAAVRRFWQIPRLGASIDGHFERAPVYAPGLYDVLVYLDRLFKAANPPDGKPILIAETGAVDQIRAAKERGEAPPPGAVDLAAYLRQHVREVQRAHADGVNVIGLLVWSLMSNREWGLRFGPASDFGLYHVDLDRDPDAADDRRLPIAVPTPAVEAYRQIIRARGVRDPG